MSLVKNTIWNLAGNIIPLLMAALFIPFCLNQMGGELFGLLTLVWSLIGYFNLFDFGVSRALTFKISRFKSRSSQLEISQILCAALWVTLLTGLAGASLFFLISSALASQWLIISDKFIADATAAFKFLSIGVIIVSLSNVLRGFQEGLGEFKVSNINKIFLGISTFCMPPISIYFHGPSIKFVVAYLMGGRFIMLLINVVQVKKYYLGFDYKIIGKEIKDLYSFGFWATISGVIGLLMLTGDRFLVGATVGANLLPFYAIPQEGLMRLLIIPGAFCSALLPRLIGLPFSQCYDLYKKSLKQVALIMFWICFFIALVAYPALSLWISSKFAADSIIIVLILTLGVWVGSLATVPFTFLHARGNTKIPAIFHGVELIFYIVILYFLVKNIGLVGFALAWTLRLILDFSLLWLASKNLSNTS